MECLEQKAREARTELSGILRYGYGAPENSGVARWCDVSRSGAGIQLGRYLRPGRELMLEVESEQFPEAPLCLRARVMWCGPSRHAGQFSAGLLVYRDTPEQALAFASLALMARQKSNTSGMAEVIKKPLWALFVQRDEATSHGGMAQAQAV